MRSTAKTAYNAEGQRKYLSGDEGRRFIRYATTLPQERAMFCLTIYYTGCRVSEALALRHSDIDSDMKVIAIRTLKKRNRHEIRRIPAPEFLVTGLASIELTNLDRLLWSFSRTTAWRIIKKVMKVAQISGIHATTKGLRHGFGVQGAMMQVPVTLIQAWMGHSDPSTTAIYRALHK